MEKVKTFALEKPTLFAIFILLLSILLTELPMKPIFAQFLEPQVADYAAGVVGQTLVGLFLLALIIRFGIFSSAGFRAPRWRELWLAWPLVVLSLLNASDLFTGALAIDTSQPARIAGLALVMLSVGFFEEILGRGLILVLMLRKWGNTRRGIYQAVIVSSLVFGLGHLVNVLQNRYTLGANLTQITYSFFFAVTFAACFLRMRSIWPVMLLHAVFDFAGSLQEIAVGGSLPTAAHATLADALVVIAITALMGLWGFFILRKVEPQGADGEKNLGWAQTRLEAEAR